MSRESILIVDDNIDNLDLAQILLESEGYEVFVAENATQAVERLKSCRPKLILMDLQLPGMDGFELTRQLRKDPSLNDVLIVALSAYAMKGDEEKARAAGCDGYVTKPIDTRAFPQTIRRYLEGSVATPVANPVPA